MSQEQFNFSTEFQETVLACMVRHPEKFAFHDDILKPVYFSTTHAYLVCKVLVEYKPKYGRFPSWVTIRQLITDELKRLNQEENAEEYSDYIDKLEDADTGDVDYVLDKVVVFARERATILAVQETLDALEKGTMHKFPLLKKFEAALAVGQNMEDLGVLISGDPNASDIHRITNKLSARSYGVKCGWPLLDAIWPRGWGPGWLITFLAPPKRYKTATVLNIAYNMAKSDIGKDVLVYPCEISQELAAFRILSRISGLTLEQMMDTPFKFADTAQDIAAKGMTGRIIIKGFASKSAQLSEIRAHAKMMKEQMKLDLGAIIIDYAETVRPTNVGKDMPHYRQSAEVYTEARAIGNELGCPVIMPDRCNSETVDLPVPSMKSFQGAFEKAGIVDVAIGLCATDEEHANNDLRMFVFLNRHGKSFTHLRCTVNPETWDITVDEPAPEYREADDQRPIGHRRAGRGAGRAGGGGGGLRPGLAQELQAAEAVAHVDLPPMPGTHGEV